MKDMVDGRPCEKGRQGLCSPVHNHLGRRMVWTGYGASLLYTIQRKHHLRPVRKKHVGLANQATCLASNKRNSFERRTIALLRVLSQEQ
jgi:hypothetical protein